MCNKCTTTLYEVKLNNNKNDGATLINILKGIGYSERQYNYIVNNLITRNDIAFHIGNLDEIKKVTKQLNDYNISFYIKQKNYLK